MGHITGGVDKPGVIGVERIEKRPERAENGGILRITRRKQVVGRLAEHDLIVYRDFQHPVVKSRLVARYRIIGQVRIVDGDIAAANVMNPVSAGMQKSRALHLQADAEAVAGNAGNIGLGAVDTVGGGAHFGYDGTGERPRLKRTLEAVAEIPCQFDGHAEQAFAAHLPPLVEAVLGQKIIGCETDDGVRGLALPDDAGGLFFRCAKSKMDERIGSPLSVEVGASRRLETQPHDKSPVLRHSAR